MRILQSLLNIAAISRPTILTRLDASQTQRLPTLPSSLSDVAARICLSGARLTSRRQFSPAPEPWPLDVRRIGRVAHHPAHNHWRQKRTATHCPVGQLSGWGKNRADRFEFWKPEPSRLGLQSESQSGMSGALQRHIQNLLRPLCRGARTRSLLANGAFLLCGIREI